MNVFTEILKLLKMTAHLEAKVSKQLHALTENITTQLRFYFSLSRSIPQIAESKCRTHTQTSMFRKFKLKSTR